jgi:D-alanine-D-alanine ligase
MFHIAVVSGGYSGEREISLKSAAVVMRSLDPLKFLTTLIIIDEDRWYAREGDGREYAVDMSDFTVPALGKGPFQAVFIALHGIPGEDGKLQGYFDMIGIPYTSCDAISSALTFDKYFTKQVVRGTGALTAPAMVFNEGDPIDTEKVVSKLGLPCFVKPCRGGSSVGMSKVRTAEQLLPAIAKARAEDSRVLVETFIGGREYTCGVIESRGVLHVLPITEIISKKDFFDFEAKYTPGMAEEVTPASLSQELEIEIKATSSQLYRELNCKGVVRFDYIASDIGLCFLEVNTVPGLSDASIVPSQAVSHGWSHSELFERMLEEALRGRN